MHGSISASSGSPRRNAPSRMLSTASRELAHQSGQLSKLAHAYGPDQRDWPGTGAPFDAVVIACCSVSHLLTLDDRRRTWATAFRLLRPGGVFMLDVRVPDVVPTVVKIVHEHYPAATATSAPGGNDHAEDVTAPHQLRGGSG